MNSIISFGSYLFTPDHQYSYDDNFGNVVSGVRRLARADGGYSLYGRAKPPSAIGNVQISLWLHGPGIQAKKDNLRALASAGAQRLTMRPAGDSAESTRWCEAVIQNVMVPQNTVDRNQHQVRCQVYWQVAHPYWRRSNGTASLTTGDHTVVNAGKARTLPYFRFSNGGNVRVQRLEGSTVTHEFAYAGTFTTLDVYCEGNRVLRNGTNAYGDFTHKRGDWLVLEPGNNTIRVTGTASVSWDTLWH